MLLFGDYLHNDLQPMSTDEFLATVRSRSDPLFSMLERIDSTDGTGGKKSVAILLDFLKSDRFRDEVNRRVPPPEKGESEQHFVQRANAVIKAILDEKSN